MTENKINKLIKNRNNFTFFFFFFEYFILFKKIVTNYIEYLRGLGTSVIELFIERKVFFLYCRSLYARITHYLNIYRFLPSTFLISPILFQIVRCIDISWNCKITFFSTVSYWKPILNSTLQTVSPVLFTNVIMFYTSQHPTSLLKFLT
jgi:hypothetical protein